MQDLRGDVQTLSAQVERSRTRLHNLEGFAQAYLSVQRENRRQEDRQYRRLAQAIQFGGLVMAVAMFVLAAVTLWAHVG